MRKTVGISDGVGQNNTMCSFVERFSDISEPLLTCSIPDIERYLTSLKFDSFDFEINTDGTEVIGLKGVLAISYKKTCFSDSTVSDN